MLQIEGLGREETWERDLFMLEVSKISETPEQLLLPSRYFACLLAWDATEISADDIRSVGQKLIQQGAAYFCIWGPDCERVHDVIDEVEEVREQANPDDESVIMTTWHNEEPLSEAIWYVLYSSLPDDPYISECKSTLAICIGSPEWAAQIRMVSVILKSFLMTVCVLSSNHRITRRLSRRRACC